MNVDFRPSGSSSRIEGHAAIGGRFRLVRLLGEGGMGVVWEALDLTSHEPRAVKFLRAQTHDASAHRRFLREAEALRGLSHPNIVRILDIATDDDGTPAIVMELLRGESLATRLARVTTMSLGQTCAVLAQVAHAVQAAHASGIIHRDLKPDNIFLCVDEGAGAGAGAGMNAGVRVLDFGVAKRLEATPDKLTDTGTLVGTPHYMSPEQASGDKDLDGRTDVWAIAVIAFECLTGRMPVVGQNYGQLLMQLITGRVTKLGEVRTDLPAELVTVVDAALVAREHRIEMNRLASALSAHADRGIESPAMEPRSTPAFSAARTLAMAPTSSSRELDGAAVVDVPPSAGMRTATRAVAAFAVVSILTLGAGLFVASRHQASGVDASASATQAAETTPPISASVAARAIPSAASATPPAEMTASAAPASQTATPKPKITPRPPATPAPSGTPATTATGGRLQGGVGADVPF